MYSRSFLALLLFCVSILFLLVEAAPSTSPKEKWKYVVHEKRSATPHGWTKLSRLSPETRLPVRIALKQENLHLLEEELMKVSDPESEDYGKHWDREDIKRVFGPRKETWEGVVEWLVKEGVKKERIWKGDGGWVGFEGSVREVEGLLRTEYAVWRHEEAEVDHVACEGYWIPEHVQHHIDFITPTVHFDARLDPLSLQESKNQKRNRNEKRKGAGFANKAKPNSIKIAPCPQPPPPNPAISDCSNNITPDCLRALYGIPTLDPKTKLNPNNSFGVVQYTPQSYVTSDLAMFFSNYSKNQVQKKPILHSVDGGNVYDTPDMSSNIEADLDLEYAMALVNPLNVTLYQVGDLIETDYTSFNNFLDALDASYCQDNETATTSPTIDAIYPDPLPGGYTGPRNCGGYKAAKVISTSYSYNEHDLTAAYEQRQCNEYAKLGLTGTTFLYCSGDYGVAGSLSRCLDPSTNTLGPTDSGLFAPSFPSTCPYVLSVGATQIVQNATVYEPEIACATRIASGGGFSNVFPMPDYQKSAVKNWFKWFPSGYGADRFNNSQTMRGYPDVSANGAKYVVALVGSYNYHLFGTSAATPVVASMITLLNEARMNIGKGSIGFINPTLYANPWMLNDIISGSNPGCGTNGFSATPGWDPVTGLGTPNYPKMLAYFLTH